MVALLVAGSVIWFLAAVWFPTTREAVRRLPGTGVIQDQLLSSPHSGVEPLAGSRFLTFAVNMDGASSFSLDADVRVEFHRRNLSVCSLLGCLWLDYPRGWTIQFNRPELESWWAAWEPILYAAVGVGSVALLFTSWFLLATLCCPMVRFYSFFKDRQLTLLGSWKLASAALLPGAFLTAAGIVCYGLGLISLLEFLLLWALHFALGLVFLLLSPLRLPRASDAIPALRDPFAKPRPGGGNPFSTQAE